MRLKYFFLPVILILAAIVFWAYIRPEISSLQAARDDYNLNQQILQNVESKKSALETLSSKIQTDDGSALVLNYLPSNKMEEKIIGDVNYIASNSGVFLNNLEIVSSPSPAPGVIVPVSPADVKTSDALQNIQLTITAEGDYNKLKTFFDAVQRMSLLNTVKSLSISTVEKNSSSDPAATQSAVTIVSKLVVDFGYLKQVKADDKKLANFNSSIDNATIQKLKDYTSNSTPKVSMEGIVSGSSNPFLP